MSEKIKVVAVVGPTASGKTGAAIHLAKRFGGEIVSVDSMQIYKYMDIGSAKPTAEERKEAVHHMVDFLDPRERFSVAQYVEAAGKVIKDIASRGKTVIAVGGTGLYMDSLLDGISFSETSRDDGLREELKRYADENGNECLLEMLREIDAESAERLHPNNVGRVIRAIEIYRLTGVTMSEHIRRSKESGSEYDVLRIGLDFKDREKLYSRIDARVDEMIEKGLLSEARTLREAGMSATASQAIGYKELYAYMDGEKSFEECVEDIKRETRRYAKRQLTWYRRNKAVKWLYYDEYESVQELLSEAQGYVSEFLFD